MKLTSKIKMVPLLVGIGFSSTNTDFSYSEQDIVNNNVGINRALLNSNLYNEFYSEKKFLSHVYIANKFEANYYNWLKQTRFISNPNVIIENKHFQNIVKLGESAIPFILNKINEEPSAIIWALNKITGIKISSSPSTTITEACKLWIKWGKKNT